MTNMENIINFLKWQLLARLPNGSIFERIKGSIVQSGIDELNPLYYIYWLDIDKSLFKKYLFGTFSTTNEDYIKFISWLDTKYLKGNFYEINVDGNRLIIPRPHFQDYKCFKAEFLDIIMPLLTNHLNQNIPYLEGPYEYEAVSLNKGDVVLDLGANYGLFSSLASSKGCKVYAFEPTKEVVDRYLKHLSQIDENIEVITRAISNVIGTSAFKLNPHNSSCNCLVEASQLDDSSYTTIETTTVDDFVEEKRLESVDFIKADIEGSERLMLEGAKRTLKKYAPKLAICYYHCLDDLRVLSSQIKEANPHYEIEVEYKKIYAHDPRKEKRRSN